MVIEIITFRLAADAEESAFLDADQRVQTEFIPNHRGFMRRTTARGADREWVVVALWDTEQDAETSMQLWRDHPVTQGFMSLVDPASFLVGRYAALD
jgi:hypothetical protein